MTRPDPAAALPEAPSTALVVVPAGRPGLAGTDRLALAELVSAWGGDHAAYRTDEFLKATIHNLHTRRAYHRAARRFVAWCTVKGLELRDVDALEVAAHLDALKAEGASASTVKLHLAALNHWFDHLVLSHVMRLNPAHSVRGPRVSSTTGKTPILEKDQARVLLASIDGTTLIGARDLGVIATMLFSFARIGAVLGMKVRDYRGASTRHPEFLLHEKGGKLHRVPASMRAAEHVEAWLALSGLAATPDAPLWQSIPHRTRQLSGRALSQSDACQMVKRRCVAAGLARDACNHSFRAMGITYHQDAGGDLEAARQLAAHASVKTTQVYNRSGDRKRRAEVDRVQL